MFKWISFFIFLLFLGGCTNEPPVIKLELLEVTFDRVEFDLDVLDENELGYIDSILLLKDNSIVERKDELDGYFGNLLSDTNYSIQVIYKYQFRANQDIQTKTDTIQFTTLSYSNPSVEVQLLELGHHYLSFDINLIDPYEFIIINEIKIIDQNGLEMIINNSDVILVKELYSDHEYRVKIIYSFDLNDGLGLKEKEYEKTIFTEAYTTPSLDLIINSTGKHNVNFDIDFSDPDLKGRITNILLQPGSINLSNLDQFEGLIFDQLLANSEYRINVTMQYDLNDGNGLITRDATVDFNTEAYTIPELRLEINDLSTTELTFDITKIDPDNILNKINIQVTSGSSILFELDGIETLTFDQLIPNTNYHLKVNYSYDLLDGSNESSETISIPFKTLIHKGEGTIDEPYIIESPIDFQNINVYGNEKELHFVLNNDIDFDGFDLQPINYFSHNLDGRGYSLSNIFSQSNSIFSTIGFNATVRNLIIDNITITKDKFDETNEFIGGLAKINYGSLFNVHVSGNLSGHSIIGGVVGDNTGIIDIVSFSGEIIGYSNKNRIFLGGISGRDVGTIDNAFVQGLFKAETEDHDIFLGGITGYCRCQVRFSFIAGEMIGKSNYGEVYLGDVIGYLESGQIYGTISIINNKSASSRDTTFMNGATGQRTTGGSLIRTYIKSGTRDGIVLNNEHHFMDFYILELKWDSDVWDLSKLDIPNRGFPTNRIN